MRLVINAIPIHPGGGLTVVRGVAKSIRAVMPRMHLTLLSSFEATHRALLELNVADEVIQVRPNASPAELWFWQNFQAGKLECVRRADVFLTVNHHVRGVGCPQVVYHLNLLRFQPRRFADLKVGIQDRVRDWLADRALSYADANVFESRYLLDMARQSHGGEPKNPHVIYIGLPDELLTSKRASQAVGESSRRLLSVTSPAEHKDNPTLIRTLATLVALDASQDWRLDVAGGIDPSAWDATKTLARELNVLDRVTFHGFCDHTKLTQLMEQALCVVCTSRVESFAMVALESMARNCPPVVANCTSMPESVANAGLLADPGSPESFAQVIRDLHRSPKLREQLVVRGQEWVKKFRWSHCGEQFAELLATVAGGANRAGRRAA